MADLTLVLSSLILFEIGRGSRDLLDSNHDRLWALRCLICVSYGLRLELADRPLPIWKSSA